MWLLLRLPNRDYRKQGPPFRITLNLDSFLINVGYSLKSVSIRQKSEKVRNSKVFKVEMGYYKGLATGLLIYSFSKANYFSLTNFW